MWVSCPVTCTFGTQMITGIFVRTGTSWNSLIMLESQVYYCTRSGERVWASRWGVFTADWSDVVLHQDVSRSKKAAQLLSVILKSNLRTIIGIWELHDWVKEKKNILCPLCNKSQQRLCVLMRAENMSFSPTSPIKLILKSSSVACFGTCERQKKLSV